MSIIGNMYSWDVKNIFWATYTKTQLLIHYIKETITRVH